MKYEQMVSACGCGPVDKKQDIPGLNKTHTEGDFLSTRLVHTHGIWVI